jgi:Arc/MetJ-type ribon-helix-helix transcriptional regulator
MAKISISLDDTLLAAIRQQAPSGNVSGWLAEAAERRLRNEALRAYAAEVEAESGPFTSEELEAARAWLPSATQRS